MRIFMSLCMALTCYQLCCAQATIPNDELIVLFRPAATITDIDELLDELDMHIVDGPTENLGATLLRYNTPPIIPAGTNPLDSINGEKEQANSKTKVGGAGLNYGLSTNFYKVENCGSEVNCYDILDPSTQPNGGNEILGGIFDTGISEKISTSNGFFDMTDLGYNAINTTTLPFDDHNHGSHVSSIVMNNLENTNEAVQLKAYKTHDRSGEGYLFNVIKALDQAISDSVQVANMSFSYSSSVAHGQEAKLPLKHAIDRARELVGMLIVTSAGNNNSNNDMGGSLTNGSEYPASFDLPNIISVASADCKWHKSDFSNYGPISVDVFAPGDNILGRNRDWGYMTMSGTSQAAAFVSKLAIYLGTHQTTFSWFHVKCAILHSAQPVPHTGYVLTNGHIDSEAALTYLLNTTDCSLPPDGFGSYTGNLPPSDSDISVEIMSVGIPLTLEIKSDMKTQLNLMMTNISGAIIHKEILQIEKGVNIQFLPEDLEQELGLYLINVRGQDFNETIKLVK